MTCMETMTSDTAKPETTTPQTKPETFRSHLPAIVAATTGTVLAAILGSLIGTAGTIVGMVIGSLAAGTCSWWAERGIRRSAALATARAETLRAHGYHLRPGDVTTVTQEAVAAQEAVATHETVVAHDTAATQDTTVVPGGGRHGRSRRRSRWAGPAAIIGAAFIGCAVAVTLVEGAAGKPLSAVVQGKPGHGTTLGGGAVSKATPVKPSPTPSASTAKVATTTPATSATPSAASSSSAASTAPATAAPSSSTPASSAPASSAPASSAPASATPTATPTVPAGG
jgi:hypothetical protein